MGKFLRHFSLLITATFFLSNVSCKDDTQASGAVGKDVVESVLRTVSRSRIFPEDHSFIIRLAYVESRFGANNNTFRNDYYGGIWQVEESVFGITQADHTSINTLKERLQSLYAIDWNSLTWRNLLSPLHSALAARLYFARVPEPIPDTIEKQAAHWKKYYRPLGDVNRFIEDVREFQNRTRCRGKMDLSIVLDSSGSIGDLDYERAKNFTADMIQSFTLDHTRIGMLVYSRTVEDIFHVANPNNLTIEEMADLARKAKYLKSGTRTDLGMLRAIEMFNETPMDDGVPEIMTVFTDGETDIRGADLPAAIKAVAERGIKPIAVGVGSGANITELTMIALNDSRNVFELTDFLSLNDFLFSLTSVTCDIPQRPTLNASYDDSLIQDEKRVYTIPIPASGITLSINITLGKTSAFWSYTEEVPNSAVNDGEIGSSTYIPAPNTAVMSMNRQGSKEATVYFSVTGLEEENHYVISTTEGGRDAGGGDGEVEEEEDDDKGNGSPSLSFASFSVFALISLHLFW